jgi:hypothetical protein
MNGEGRVFPAEGEISRGNSTAPPGAETSPRESCDRQEFGAVVNSR